MRLQERRGDNEKLGYKFQYESASPVQFRCILLETPQHLLFMGIGYMTVESMLFCLFLKKKLHFIIP